MSIDVWIVYVFTVLALMSTPGPSQLLMLSNSGVHGLRKSLFTAAGDLSANALQMLAAGLGLAALIAASANALFVIKWAGVAYLIWLGVRMIRKASSAPASVGAGAARASRKSLWIQGFVTSAANPKAVVFFAALFPQFISDTGPFWPQFLILSATYLILDGLFLTAYGLGAQWMVARFKGAAKRNIERLGGSAMILAAVLLSFKTLSSR